MATNRLQQMKRKLLGQQNNKERTLIAPPDPKNFQDPLTVQDPPRTATSNVPEHLHNSGQQSGLPQIVVNQIQEKPLSTDGNKQVEKQGLDPHELSKLQPQNQQQPAPGVEKNGSFHQILPVSPGYSIQKEAQDCNKRQEKKASIDEEDNRARPPLANPEHEKINGPSLALQQKGSAQEANLDLGEKHPNYWCSVDEEVKGSVQPEVSESKVLKKQRKIILKELQSVLQCVRNLKSAVKGLKLLEARIGNNPRLRGHLKFYLSQLSKLGLQEHYQ